MKVLFLTFILTLAFAQVKNPNCAKWSGSQCLSCNVGWSLQQGDCINDNSDPCPGKLQCGEAKNFANLDEFKKFVDANPNPNQFGGVGGGIIMQSFATTSAVPAAAPSAARVADAPTAKSAATSSTPRDFSQTNNQVSSVDEADILKTDGSFIYTISGTTLHIVKAFPYLNAGMASKINFKDAPQSLFIEGNNLAVFGTSYTYFPCNRFPIDPIFPVPLPIDVVQTEQIDSVSAAGGARLLQQPLASKAAFIRSPVRCRPPENKVFLYIYNISNKKFPRLINNFQFEGYYQDGRKYDGFIYLISNVYFYDRFYDLPFYTNSGVKTVLNPQNVFFFTPRYQWPLFVNIFAFNLRAPSSKSFGMISIISENSGNIYMSPNNLYLTYAKWNWQSISFSQETVIHKIYMNKLRMVPFADGVVKGYINNQFFMDEYKQFFRIATTLNSGTTSNNVYCLNRYLTQVGALENLAKGETIFSVRFVGPKVYVVTFRQIDPFFVIDLTDHYQPKVLGQLKIPGFSRYLHPYDDTTIIGIGRQTDANGRQQGLKVSLFDVSDVGNPQQISSYELQQQYVSSSAQWEHKAFLFSKQKSLMVIPASYYNYQDQLKSFNGAFVFNVQKDFVDLTGIVDHVQGNFDRFWERSVERSLYIETLLYTKSPCLIRINTLAQLNGVRNIELCANLVNPDQLSQIPIF